MSKPLRLLGEAPATPTTSPWSAKGFRPFFLAAGSFAALLLPLWLLVLAGRVRADAYFDPIAWHAHEMIFGFTVAVIAGFLLTAVGNWTSQETAVGAPLGLLLALFVAGRIALAAAAVLPRGLVAAVDLAFLPALGVAVGGPILRTKNRRNYPILAMLTALFVADLAMHLDVLGVIGPVRRRAAFVAVDVVTLLIVFLAARIFPMFTRNATRVESIANQPKLDWATTIAMAALVLVDAFVPERGALAKVGAVLAGVVALLAVVRSSTWGARHSLGTPLLWILHVGHAFVPLGLALRAVAAFVPRVPSSAALHALTAGAIGCTTLGMMARVSLGHTGRALVPTRPVAASFGLVTAAALLRVAQPFFAGRAGTMALHTSGTLFAAAFLVFVVTHVAVLTRPRIDGKPG